MDMLSTLETVVNNAVKVDALFPDYAIVLIGMLAVIALSWAGIKGLLEGDSANSAIANIVRTMFIAGLATAIIGTNTGSGLGKKLIEGFDAVATAASGGAVSTSAPGTMIKSTVSEMLKTAGLMFIGKTQDEEAASPTVPSGEGVAEDGKNAWDYVTGVVSSTWDKMSIAGIAVILTNLFYKFFMAVALLLATLVFVGQFVVTQIMINIGLALMPIMVPWILLDATSFVFEGWLKFMITAGMTKVIGAVIFGLTSGAMNSAVELSNKGYETGEPGVMFMAYAGSFLIVGMLALLMMQSTGIATGLIAGRALGTWRPAGKMEAGKGMTTASRGASGAASSAGSGMNKAAGGITGGIAGGVKGGASAAKASQGGMARSVGAAVGGAAKGAMRGANAGSKSGISGQIRAKINGSQSGSGSNAPGGAKPSKAAGKGS